MTVQIDMVCKGSLDEAIAEVTRKHRVIIQLAHPSGRINMTGAPDDITQCVMDCWDVDYAEISDYATVITL